MTAEDNATPIQSLLLKLKEKLRICKSFNKVVDASLHVKNQLLHQ